MAVRSPTLRFGIRLQLLLVTFAIGSLFVLYIAFNTARQATRDRGQVREDMGLIATLATSRLDDHVGDVTQLLNALAGTVRVESSDASQNDAMLRSLAPQLPRNVHDVSLWSADGANIGTSELLPAGARPSASDRPFFLAAVNDPGLAIEAPLRLHKAGDWTAVFALRIVRDAKIIAVVSVATNLTTLPGLLDPDHALPPSAVISVANAEGRIVSRSLDPERWISQPAPIDRTQILARLGEGRGTAETTGLDGVPRIFGFSRSRVLPWLVYVGIPVDTALASTQGNARESFLLGMAMLAAGLLFAAWTAGRIARPLRELSDDAQKLGEGDFDHRSNVVTGGEVGLLARNLNRMADALQERIATARRTAERLALALEGSDQALFDWDIRRNVIHYSSRASTLRGGADVDTELTPDDMRAFVHPEDISRVLARLSHAANDATSLYEAEYRIRHVDGRWIWLRSRGRVVERDAQGHAVRLVGTDTDVTERKKAEAALRQRAEFDVLTGLPNRALFNDRLAGAIERSARNGKALALLFLDIDRLKEVNDTRGHEAGDELLKTAATRLLAAVRSADTVARLAGDEFTVILEGLSDTAAAEAVAKKLVESLRVPMRIGDALLRVSTSVGIAMLAPGETDAAGLLRRADAALYEAKRAGRNRFVTSTAA